VRIWQPDYLNRDSIQFEAFRESMRVISKLKNLEEVSIDGADSLTEGKFLIFPLKC